MQLRACFIARMFIGFLCSLSLSTLLVRQYTMNSVWRNSCHYPSQFVRFKNLRQETNVRDLVLVSVMTYMGTIKTRAVAIQKTWAPDIPGKLIFFVGSSANKTEVDLPLVVLPVDDDVYPPQEKAMLMLKYVYENYGDSYRWFIRADDDVYVNCDNLARLLISISSESDDILLGHPGIGTNQEKGKLGLEEESNFCIGGTAIVMSRPVLKKVYPHLDHCIKNTATVHEDSEVGRCVRKFVGVQCPWGYEASEMFYQDYGVDQLAYHGDLDLINFEKVVSLHPVKDPSYLYRLHHHFLSIKQRRSQNHSRKLRKHLKFTNKLLASLASDNPENLFRKPGVFFCQLEHCGELHTAEDGIHSKNLPPKTWTMFLELQSFGVEQFSTPVESIRSSKAKTLRLITERAKLNIIEEEKPELYHGFYFGECAVGYTRESPIRGNLYEVHYTVRMKRHTDGILNTLRKPRRVKFKNSYASLVSRIQQVKSQNELINIVLPSSGSTSRFEDFLNNIHKMLEKFHEALRVFVVFFREVTLLNERFKNIFENYRRKFGDLKFVWLEVNGKFSQETALNAVLKYITANQLLLFTETNFIFNADFLKRCRQNTEKKRLYFPLALETSDKKNTYLGSRWGFEKFLTFCGYSDDISTLQEKRPMNGSLEASSLVDLLIAREERVFEVFRAPDPGLFLQESSRSRCLTKGDEACTDKFDSTNALFDYLFKKGYLKDFLE